MNQGNILEKMVDAGITNETFSAEDVMERMMKKRVWCCGLAKVLLFMIQMGELWNILLPALKKKDIR